jgi:hypothetical protein
MGSLAAFWGERRQNPRQVVELYPPAQIVFKETHTFSAGPSAATSATAPNAVG